MIMAAVHKASLGLGVFDHDELHAKVLGLLSRRLARIAFVNVGDIDIQSRRVLHALRQFGYLVPVLFISGGITG